MPDPTRPVLSPRVRLPRPMAWDVLLTIVLSPFIAVIGLQVEALVGGGVLPTVAVAAFVLPLLWRRSRPLTSAGVLVAAHLLQLVLINEPSPANLTIPLTLFAVARWSPSVRARRVYLGIGLLGAAAAGIDWGMFGMFGSSTLAQDLFLVVLFFVLNAAVVAASWLLGALTRQRADAAEQARERLLAAERERGQNLRLAAQEERARIAREMHDIVAHSLSVIVVQADGAAYAVEHAGGAPAIDGGDGAEPDPARRVAAQALQTIGRTAREALADTRRLVAVLRDEGAGAEYSPQAGVDSIDDLVAPLREAGRDVTVTVSGARHVLPRGAGLAAYRVVQESLTNIIKHAGPDARAQVRLDYERDALLVSVVDDGRGAAADGDGHGHGLVGMAERVAAFGGTLSAGPAPGGGFGVLARIPYDEHAPLTASSTPAGPTVPNPGRIADVTQPVPPTDRRLWEGP